MMPGAGRAAEDACRRSVARVFRTGSVHLKPIVDAPADSGRGGGRVRLTQLPKKAEAGGGGGAGGREQSNIVGQENVCWFRSIVPTTYTIHSDACYDRVNCIFYDTGYAVTLKMSERTNDRLYWQVLRCFFCFIAVLLFVRVDRLQQTTYV